MNQHNWSKIPYNSDNKPRGLFLIKGPFRQFFLGGGGLYMDEYLRFENAIFCSSNCIFFEIFCSQPVFTTDFSYFFRSSVIRTVNINYRTHTV